MTKLWIGLGVLIVIGALFGALMTLWTKISPEEEPSEEHGEEEKGERLRAVVHCTGGGASFTKYRYQGVEDCLAASLLPGGGPMSCEYGCLGMGTCAKVCPAGAIQVREGVAVVDRERCTACGECVEACPRHIVSLELFKPQKHVFIPCASQALEETVTELCTDGCIGCSLCVKACPKEAVTVEGGLARIDYEKCDNCGLCAQKCPRHLIRVEPVAEPPKPELPKPSKPPKEKKLKKEKVPKQRKEFHLPKMKLPQKPAKEGEALKEEPAPAEQEIQKAPVSVEEKAVTAEVPAVPETPEAADGEKEPSRPGSESPAEEGKPTEGTKTSAEAFKAFEQAVAAVDEALGEKKDSEASGGAEPAGTKTE